MSKYSKYFLNTIATVHGNKVIKNDQILNLFKSFKNAKLLTNSAAMLKVIVNPNSFTDSEIPHELLINSELITFFESFDNSELKLKVFGFVLRMCSFETLCRNVTGCELSGYVLTERKLLMLENLSAIFKPLVICMEVSVKSKCDKRLRCFANLTKREFETVKEVQ